MTLHNTWFVSAGNWYDESLSDTTTDASQYHNLNFIQNK